MLQHRRPPFHFPVRIGSIPWRMRSAFASAPSSRLWWRRKRKRRWAGASAINARVRPRAIATATGIGNLSGTFGALTVSLPRVRLLDGDGGEKDRRSQTIQAYKRLTKRAEAIIANTYLAGTNTRRVRRALAGRFGGKVGKDAVSRAWRKVKTDWESWQARDLSGEDIVRLILDGKADYTDMMYAENAEDVRKKRKAFLAK